MARESVGVVDWPRIEEAIVAAVVATEVPPRRMASPVTGKPSFEEEMIEPAIRAVIDVIRNRVKAPRFPNSATEVVLWPRQFSAVGREEYFAKAAAGKWFPQHVERCAQLWREEWPDTTSGSLFYWSPVRMEPPGRSPAWADAMDKYVVPGIGSWWFTFARPRTP